jgi:hypothetical protein
LNLLLSRLKLIWYSSHQPGSKTGKDSFNTCLSVPVTRCSRIRVAPIASDKSFKELSGFSPSQSLQAFSSLAALLPLATNHRERKLIASPTGLYSLRRSDTCRCGFIQAYKPLPSWFFCPPGISPLPNRPRLHGTSPPELSLPSLRLGQAHTKEEQMPFRVFRAAGLAFLLRDRHPS